MAFYVVDDNTKIISKKTTSLVNAALSIQESTAIDDGALGFTARSMVLATLPHSKTNEPVFERKNGDYTLSIRSVQYGVPYGSIPRILLAWMATEAVRTNSPHIILGNTLSEFMEELDMVPTGGRWGSITRLKDQINRLFDSDIKFYKDTVSSTSFKKMLLAEEAEFWWSTDKPTQGSLMESYIKLSPTFFNEIISSPVPIDLRALKALKKSPMALDIYCWSTYRVSYLKKRTCITWEGLQAQFGAGYPFDQQGKRNFKKKFIDALKKVTLLYPELNCDVEISGLILKPSKTHVPKIGK